MKLILALPTFLLILSSYSYASPSLVGDSGFINTPSSETITDRNINIGISYLLGQRSYVYTGKPNFIYSMSLGFIPRTELGINFNQVIGWVTPDNPYLGNSAIDRSVNIKFQLLSEDDMLPSIAIGGRDVFSNAVLNQDRIVVGSTMQQMFYFNIGKTIYDFKTTLGYAYAPGIPLGFGQTKFEKDTEKIVSQSFRVSGIFAGIETPKFLTIVSGIIEYDSKYFNYGINLEYNGFQAKLAMVDLTNFNTRISWSTKL